MEDCQAAQSWSSYLPEPHSACGHNSNRSSPTRLGRQKVVRGVGSPAGNAVVEGVRSCSSKRGRGEEETDDGLRQFKRQLTESFFDFMRSDQPKRMYNLTMVLRRGSSPEATDNRNVASLVPVEFADSQRTDACQADGLHVASMRYPVLNEWEMCVEFPQQVDQRQSPGRDSVQGRQASNFVPRVSFSPRMDPDALRYAEQVIEGGIQGGSVRMTSPFHSAAGKMPGACPSQDLIVSSWAQKNEKISVQIRTLPPLYRSLNSMVSLRPRLLAGDNRRFEIYGLVDWPGLWSRMKLFSQECEGDGRIDQTEELQSLVPFAPSVQPPFTGGREDSEQSVEAQGVKVISDEPVTLENVCLQAMKGDTRSFVDPPLPSCLHSCLASELTDFPGGSQERLTAVLDKGSCQENLATSVVQLLAGTSNSEWQSTFNSSERPSIYRPLLPGNGSKERQRQVQCPKWSHGNGQSHDRNLDHAQASFDYMYVKGERGERDVPGSRDVQTVRDLQRGRDVRRITDIQMAREVKRESDVKREREVKRQREIKWERDVIRGRDAKRERDVESSAPVLIVLSDSSDNDSEQLYTRSTARDQTAFQQSKQDNRIHRRLLQNTLTIVDKGQKRPKYEHQYDGDLYFRNVQNGLVTPSSGYHQFAEHNLKRPKPFRETPYAGRSGWPVEKKQASNHPARFVSDEGKWTAGITCDLCGRGPSLACGEWYAWCCGKMKSSCCCPPQRRTIKLPSKSKAVPRIVKGYVHRMCAIWSAEVVEQNDYMQDLSSAVRRGLSLKCAHCQKFGATMGCRVGRCRKSFHYPCADLLASRLQLRMWEGCSVAIACKEHQHIDSVCEAPIKLSMELRSATNLIPYLGSNLVCQDLSNNQEVVRIPCTNDVDDEPLPQVKYITKCRYNRAGGVMREGMCPGKAELAKGCQGCTRYDLDDPYAPISVHLPKTRSRCTDLRTDWQHQPMHGRLAYDEFGRLQLGSETIDVVECNVRCKCGVDCKNRVLQNGLQVRLEVFRTKNRGWGVRTLDDLPRGTFVVEYVGELLTHDEADVRGQQYDAMHHSCLFNMDHPDVPQDEILVLDGYSMSNVARFINHSCDGNLVVCRVYTESIEPKFCRIALFTNRDIWAGTELCYDYSYNTKDMSKEDVQRVLRHPETIRCRCGSSNCRKVLWRGGS